LTEALFGAVETGAGLEHLKLRTGLQGLDLRGIQVTDAGVEELKKSLPNVSGTR
jgi:hypothetical protein